MTSDRKKPGVAFWATVALVVVLVGYPLSCGPAIWLAQKLDIQWFYDVTYVIYAPLSYAGLIWPRFGTNLVQYIGLFVDPSGR